MEGRKGLYYALLIGGIALALTYIFWTSDFIPDGAGLATPATFLGWVDDAAAIAVVVFTLSRWRSLILGTKQTKGLDWKYKIGFVAVIALALVYIFWIVDLIPDTIPYIGWADDAAAVIAGIYIIGKLRKRILSL